MFCIYFYFFQIFHRSRLAHAGENTGGSYDQQRGGTHTRGGSGETLLEKQKRVIAERERKLKKKLDVIKKQREQVRHHRHKRHVPTVAVVGYTNAGMATYTYNDEMYLTAVKK